MNSPREVDLESMLMQQSTARLGRIHELEAEVAALKERLSNRDRDWILAMADALGTDSGYQVPIVPEPAPFKKLFAALARGGQG